MVFLQWLLPLRRAVFRTKPNLPSPWITIESPLEPPWIVPGPSSSRYHRRRHRSSLAAVKQAGPLAGHSLATGHNRATPTGKPGHTSNKAAPKIGKFEMRTSIKWVNNCNLDLYWWVWKHYYTNSRSNCWRYQSKYSCLSKWWTNNVFKYRYRGVIPVVWLYWQYYFNRWNS